MEEWENRKPFALELERQVSRGIRKPDCWSMLEWQPYIEGINARLEAERSRIEVEFHAGVGDKIEFYRQYMCSPEWHARRAIIRYERENKCERCGGKDSLQIHHLTYERLGDERPEDLELLCGDCHMREHGKRRSPVIGFTAKHRWGLRKDVETAPQRTISIDEYLAQKKSA